MKKTDIAMVVLIATVSILVTGMVINSIAGNPDEKTKTIKVIDPVMSNFAEPSAEIFNDKAINPTIKSVIGGDEKIVEDK